MPRFSLERPSHDGLSSFKNSAYQSPAGVLKKDARGAFGVLRGGRGLRDSDGISFSLFSDIALVFHFST